MTVSKEREASYLRVTKLKVELQQTIPVGMMLDEVVSALIELAQLYQSEIIIRNAQAREHEEPTVKTLNQARAEVGLPPVDEKLR